MAGMRFILTAMAAGRNGVKSKVLVWRAMQLWLSGYQGIVGRSFRQSRGWIGPLKLSPK